jgi:methionyl-tRNA synthetase
MIARFRDGEIVRRDTAPPWDADELRETIVAAFDRFDITNALEEIWQRVRRLNQFVEESAPWQLAKDETRADELSGVLYNLADGLTAIAIAIAPYLPDSAPRILTALRQPADDLSLARIHRGTALPATGIEPAAPLFPRVELPAAAT